jgi:hypothetical protein
MSPPRFFMFAAIGCLVVLGAIGAFACSLFPHAAQTVHVFDVHAVGGYPAAEIVEPAVVAPAVVVPPDPPPVEEPEPHEEVAEAGPIVVAVMIDNLPGASRPQIGLDRADRVYEFLVEGGITRFMAVYVNGEADRIEPVRSARTPSVMIARELDALLAHVGAAATEGEADADGQIAAWGVRAIDGDVDQTPFRRDRQRPAPHNMMTSTAALRGRARELGWSGSLPAVWPVHDGGAASTVGRPARRIDYTIALYVAPQRAFAAAWDYDGATNSYRRSMAGAPHVDGGSGARLSAANVVLQVHTAHVVDRDRHVLYDQVGEGPAWVFRDGVAFEARWCKRSIEDRTRYLDTGGEEIALNPGVTWVALLPSGSPMSWW